MKLVWVIEGDVWSSSAYAQQMQLFSQYLHDLGHESAIANVPSFELFGETLLAIIVKQNPDAIIAFGDSHPWQMAEYLGIPMLSWFLWGDKRPLPFTEQFPLVTFGCASFSAKRRLEDELGLTSAYYVPHAYDPKVFHPGTRKFARARLGWTEEHPTILMVGTNFVNNEHESGPDRKNWKGALDAFKLVLEDRPESILYAHTTSTGALDIPGYAQEIGISDSVKLADQDKMTTGNRDFDAEYMADLYRASDLLLMPSLAEGFGIPLIEAQACGIPVVTTDDDGPMSELAITGAAVKGVPDQERPEWTVPDVEKLAWNIRDWMGPNRHPLTNFHISPWSIENVVENEFLPALEACVAQKPDKRPDRVYNWIPPEDAPLKLDIGSGGIVFERKDDTWTTVDKYAPAMIQADMAELPQEDNTVEAIWSSHALEHIPRERVIPTLTEWYRVLKPGGTLTILVPDLDYVMNLWKDKGMYALEWVFGKQDTPGEFHQTGWTLEGLKSDVEDVGFVIDSAESLWTPEYTQNSLRIEAHK